jgi:cytochrome c-type biogenesis protein
LSKAKKGHKDKAARKASKTSLIIFAASLILVTVVIAYVLAQPAGRSSIGLGDPAPDFSLPVVTTEGLTSRTLELSSLRGQVVVLEFMISWCKSCRAMAPAIATLSGDYQSDQVFFLSIAGTGTDASAESTAQFMRTYGAEWTHVLDTENTAFAKYGIEATPTYFVLDRDGRVVSKFQGVTSTDALQAAIEKALSA